MARRNSRVFGAIAAVLALAFGVKASGAGDNGPTSASPAPHDMVSWVVLSNSYVKLDVDSLRAALNEAFPGEFLPDQRGSFVIDGTVSAAEFLIQSRVKGAAGTFLLISVPGPYTAFSNFADAIEDEDVRRQASAQKNWLAVDLIGRQTAESEAYRFIGIALAKLAPSDAAYLVHPTRPIVRAFKDDLRRRLAAGDAMP
jgi:hypothetical protein